MRDVVIIGSGFGGAVAACRLAEAGRDVLVLERGRDWDPTEYPRDIDDAWIFDIDEPEDQNGWLDLRFLDQMWVAQGAGVGGGSLIYANVSVDAPRVAFASGWPSEINLDVLRPYYDQVEDMLRPEVLPDNQLTPRFLLMREAAEATGAAARFRKLPLAVSFDPDGSFPERAPAREIAARTFLNHAGREQGFCIHCGNCDIGCRVQAKNTLDLNYLALARTNGAEIRALSMVSHIAQVEGGYTVYFDDISNGTRTRDSVSARQVVLAAGSLGSTEILLKSRERFGTLSSISPYLGHNWSSNGDFLTPAEYKDRKLYPSTGPTISAAIDFLDGSDNGARYFVEDGGFPDVLTNLVKARRAARGGRFGFGVALLRWLDHALDEVADIENIMPWFGQAIDGGDGRLYYGRDWLRPWQRRLKLDWNPRRSQTGVNGLIGRHEVLTKATGGEANVPPTWTVLRNLVTPHPLGGCGMAAAPSAGVVDHFGRVFGYDGLYVADGAIVPRPIGLNPSKTIAALAERIVEHLLRD